MVGAVLGGDEGPGGVVCAPASGRPDLDMTRFSHPEDDPESERGGETYDKLPTLRVNAPSFEALRSPLEDVVLQISSILPPMR